MKVLTGFGLAVLAVLIVFSVVKIGYEQSQIQEAAAQEIFPVLPASANHFGVNASEYTRDGMTGMRVCLLRTANKGGTGLDRVSDRVVRCATTGTKSESFGDRYDAALLAARDLARDIQQNPL